MELPGNTTHQKILQTFIDLFQKDRNIRAFIVFGSLVRGNWDDYSDLDLDAVVVSDKKEIVQKEIKQMLSTLSLAKFKIAVAFEEFSNEQVIILDTLDRISIRFHTLADTHPAILETMKVLCGNLSETDIKKSVVPTEKKADLNLLNNKFLELAIYVPVSLKRNKLINSLFFLTKMRQTLIQIYDYTHNIKREFDFEDSASQKLKDDLYKTYPICSKEEIQKAFVKLLDIFKNDFEEISVNKVHLNRSQLELLDTVKQY